MNIERPQARSLLLCDYLVVEEATRNVTLVNCFTRKVFDQFPSHPIDIVAFSPLSNGFGKFDIQVVAEHLGTLQLIYKHQSTAMFLDRLAENRFYLRLKGISFPVPGSYSFSLMIENEILAETRINVLHKETQA